MTIKTNNLVKRTALAFVLAAIVVPAAQATSLADVHDRQGATLRTADGDALDRNIANALREHDRVSLRVSVSGIALDRNIANALRDSNRGVTGSVVALDRNIANALRDHARAPLRETASRDAADRFRAAPRRGGR